MPQVSTLHLLTEVTATSSSSYLPVMVIQLMKERERRFHILQPGVSSVAHIAQLPAASLFIVGDTVNCLASVMAAPVPWCRLPTAGWRARDQRPSSASAHRQPRPRGRLEWRKTHCSAVWPPPGPWSNMSPVPHQHRQDGSSHCLMVKHLLAGCILARPRVCCDRMTARAEVNI